jgi:uncharacterized membrane protein YraQ (UPF0718 family)
MVDLGSLVLLMSIFGPKVAIAYVIFGLIIAVIAIIFYNYFTARLERYIEQYNMGIPGGSDEATD